MDETIHARIQELGDLELAILVCLVAQQHCVFSSSQAHTQDLQDELRLICEAVFGLQPAIVKCSATTTVDEFSEGVLVEAVDDNDSIVERGDSNSNPTLSVGFTSTRGASPSRFGSNMLDNRRIADVIIATNLDLASATVQVQALELIRTKRIFTRTAMHTALKGFMILTVVSRPGARLSHHLNDMFCMSHFHAEEDGFPYLNGQLSQDIMPSLLDGEIKELRTLADSIRLTPEMAAYLHNIVVFMRNNRYVKGGVTAMATRQLRAISKALAPLHGLNYITPSLVALAVRKIYPHRLKLATAETERSLQWGSDLEAIRELLEGVTVEDAIEDVLASVETPL